MDTFKGQNNKETKFLCLENNCELVIVPHNLTNKFQPLDLTINQKAKKFVSNQINKWYAEKVRRQLTNVKMYAYLKEQKESVIKGFEEARIM